MFTTKRARRQCRQDEPMILRLSDMEDLDELIPFGRESRRLSVLPVAGSMDYEIAWVADGEGEEGPLLFIGFAINLDAAVIEAFELRARTADGLDAVRCALGHPPSVRLCDALPAEYPDGVLVCPRPEDELVLFACRGLYPMTYRNLLTLYFRLGRVVLGLQG